MAKLWDAGTAGEALDKDVEQFLSSLAVDSRLLQEDLECSVAHSRMLSKNGILPSTESAAITAALEAMLKETIEGKLSVDADSEDVHSFIEAELVRRLGEVGKAVHAGRSRNDQVAVAFRLHMKRASKKTASDVLDVIEAILSVAHNHTETLMPGYTHLQRAQPVTLAHHLLAWCAALERDYSRFIDSLNRMDESPLGSGALAGSGLPTDREYTANLLGFARPSRNTMDAVADRDACIDYASAGASLMVHVSRFCEDIALWVSTEYSFMKLTNRASTGSSIMPQKRNPDPAELIRGKAGRVFGNLQALLVMQKGLPYAYNRDLQEDKALFFEIEETLHGALKAFAVLVTSLVPDATRMEAALEDGYLEATDVAEFLVIQGIPFRTAYIAAKNLVQICARKGKRLREINESELAEAHQVFVECAVIPDVLANYLTPSACVARRKQTGGPAPEKTRAEIARLESFIETQRQVRQFNQA